MTARVWNGARPNVDVLMQWAMAQQRGPCPIYWTGGEVLQVQTPTGPQPALPGDLVLMREPGVWSVLRKDGEAWRG